jgi:plastocyanin
MRRFAIALAAVTLVGVAAGCGGDEDEAAVTTTGNQTGAVRMDVRGDDIVEVVQHDYSFRPATLVGTPGQTLTIDLKNEGAAEHTFTIEGSLPVDEEVPPGDVGQIRITFPESGEVTLRLHLPREPRDGRQARGLVGLHRRL